MQGEDGNPYHQGQDNKSSGIADFGEPDCRRGFGSESNRTINRMP